MSKKSNNAQQSESMEQKAIELEPLDKGRVKNILESYKEKHVTHKNGFVIFVGSGGGKSTTYRNQVPNDSGKVHFVDADLIYRETHAHPVKPNVEPLEPLPWWDMGIEVIQEVEKRCGVVNEMMVDEGFWVLTTSFDPDDAYVPDQLVVVLLPWEEHKNRIIKKSGGNQYDGGAKATEEGFALVKRHREWTKQVAEKRQIPVVDSIKAAIEFVRSKEDV